MVKFNLEKSTPTNFNECLYTIDNKDCKFRYFAISPGGRHILIGDNNMRV